MYIYNLKFAQVYYNVSIFRYDEEFDSENKYHFLLETILKNKFCPLYSYDLESNACIYKKKPMIQHS